MKREAPVRLISASVGAGGITAGAIRCLGWAPDIRFALPLVGLCAILLTGCNEDQQNPDGSLGSQSGGRSMSVFGSIRPKAEQDTLNKIRQEQMEAQRKAQEAMQAQAQMQQQQNAAANPANRDLPAVDQSPISGLAGMFGFNQNQSSPVPTASGSIPGSMPGSGPSSSPMSGMPSAPSVATYGGGYQSMGGGGLIPPPPAVTLSTSAAPVPQPYQPPPEYGYYQQGYNPYAGAYPAYQQPPQPAHPAGSMFSSGGSSGSVSASVEPTKKPPPALITPTGMEARSPYKQRDDLKILLKGAFASTREPDLRDPKVSVLLARADVGLPSESTRGTISMTARQIENLIKLPALDKRVLPTAKKVGVEVTQSYYRYLYAFNKFALTQQQIAARKQELEVAESSSEKQRAAADLSATQNEADNSKEDLRAAQSDLAGVAGAQAARSVIAKVSGVAPSLESLAVASETEAAPEKEGSLLGSVGNAFGALTFWGKKKDAAAPPAPVASAPRTKDKPAKDEKAKPKKGQSEPIAARPQHSPPAVVSESTASVEPKPAAGGVISFELKNVQTTPRKSVLKVTIRNNGDENFTLDPDVISVAEGDRKLPDAAVRAEFDSTLIAPSQEVSGTVTIFGRPWNDKLTVSLSDGGRTIQLRR